MHLFESELPRFKQEFERKLAGMLSPHQLGAFILVLANSMQDESLQQALSGDLQRVFQALLKQYRAGKLQGARDDVAVFEQLAVSGIDHYQAWQSRMVGAWHCAYNPLRALRPERASGASFLGLRQRFAEDRFHFDKAFLRPEILSEETVAGKPLRLMYHKFPFAPYQLLILIDATKHLPQYLERENHLFFCRLVGQLARRLPGIGLAYNSLGASASINHFHVHGFIQQAPFPIEASHWQHNQGQDAYPVRCIASRDPERIWQRIESLHASNQPYNLLYRAGRCYLVPRPAQDQLKLPDWLPAAAWFELSGSFNLVHQQDYENLESDQIIAGLRKLQLP